MNDTDIAQIINGFHDGIYLLAIEGRCCAGKSTLAEKIALQTNAALFHTDDFFLPKTERPENKQLRYGENINFNAINRLLTDIRGGKPFSYTKFDCGSQSYKPTETALPKTINILEGSYSMHPRIVNMFDFKIYVHVDKQIQHDRLKRRNPENYDDYLQYWIPLEEKYIIHCRPQRSADLILK